LFAGRNGKRGKYRQAGTERDGERNVERERQKERG